MKLRRPVECRAGRSILSVCSRLAPDQFGYDSHANIKRIEQNHGFWSSQAGLTKGGAYYHRREHNQDDYHIDRYACGFRSYPRRSPGQLKATGNSRQLRAIGVVGKEVRRSAHYSS